MRRRIRAGTEGLPLPRRGSARAHAWPGRRSPHRRSGCRRDRWSGDLSILVSPDRRGAIFDAWVFSACGSAGRDKGAKERGRSFVGLPPASRFHRVQFLFRT